VRVTVTCGGRVLLIACDEKAPLAVQLVFQLFFAFRIRRVARRCSFVLPEIIIISAAAAAAAAATAVIVTLTAVVIGIHYTSRLRPTTTFVQWSIPLVPE